MSKPHIYGENTVPLSKRVPETKKDEIDAKFDAILDDYKLIKKLESESLDKCVIEADKKNKNQNL